MTRATSTVLASHAHYNTEVLFVYRYARNPSGRSRRVFPGASYGVGDLAILLRALPPAALGAVQCQKLFWLVESGCFRYNVTHADPDLRPHAVDFFW